MAARITHGRTRKGMVDRTYRLWSGMLNRCRNGWRYHGARGIKVCERWHSFENFLADVGEIPKPLTIDRIDNDGNYEPGNVRLVDQKAQCRNRSTNRLITIGGETKTQAEWAELSGVPPTTLRNRINLGWPESNWLLPSRSTQLVLVTIGGRTQSITAWAKETGLTKGVICQRLKRGWPPEKCIGPPKIVRPRKRRPLRQAAFAFA